MADKKITDFTELTNLDLNDLFELVDVSDTTDSPLGSNKKLKLSTLKDFISSGYINAPQEIQANFNIAYPFVPFVPTAGSETTLAEIVNYLNTRTFTINNGKLEIIKVLVKKTINGQVTIFEARYFFARNNISGDWGLTTTNGVINESDLLFLSEKTPSPSGSTNAIVIELGNIGTADVATYLNNHPQPISGQNWELLVENDYWFSYTSNGSDIVDFYRGQKPVILGSQPSGNYDVVSSDFQRISTDGVEDNSLQLLQQQIDELGLNKEDKTNKATDFVVINDVLYPTTKAVKDYIEDLKGTELASLDGGGKLLVNQLPSIAITSVVTAAENTLASFITNNANYEYQQGDAIVIVTVGGDKETYLFQGGSKTDINNYAEINNTNLLISDIDGLQSALDLKMNANGLTTNDFIRKTGNVVETITGEKTLVDNLFLNRTVTPSHNPYGRFYLNAGSTADYGTNLTHNDNTGVKGRVIVGGTAIQDGVALTHLDNIKFKTTENGTLTTGESEADSFKRTGGTSEQSLMADGSVKVFANILETSFILDDTELRNLGTTPVEILPALPANQFYDVLGVSYDYTYGTAVFNNLKRLEIGGFHTENIFLAATTSKIYKCILDDSNATIPQKGGALTVSSPDPNSTTGNGSAKFLVTYRIGTV